MSQRPGWLCGGRQERETLPFVAFWHGLLDAFWIEGWVNEVYSASRITDGNPHKVPRMVPTRDWAPPLFLPVPFHEGNVIGHARGPGPASLNSGYGSTHRSINSGVPFGKGTGRFSPASGSRRPWLTVGMVARSNAKMPPTKAFACGWLRHHPARRVNDQPMTLADRPNRGFRDRNFTSFSM